jgi:hypothetical protein
MISLRMNIFLQLLLCCILTQAQKIDRQALVHRHNVVIDHADSLSSLTVGNGRFAFAVDVTGLQSFPGSYSKGVPLGTESEWGWHSFIDTSHYKIEEAVRTYHINGRDIGYTVQWNNPARNKAATEWFRQNPHRLQLGNVGMILTKKDGSIATLNDLKDIHQVLDLWTGKINSHFTLEGNAVDITTFCHQQRDEIAFSVRSPLLMDGRLQFYLRFPYPTGEWMDEGTNESDSPHQSSRIISQQPGGTLIKRTLDTTNYYVQCGWKGSATIKQSGHSFIFIPTKKLQSFEMQVSFQPQKKDSPLPSYTDTKLSSEKCWMEFWKSGGAVDFSGSTDLRAFELERRIILSQYLIKAQEAGAYPPQETGLTYNSWFGKPHLEMHWWHAAHFALWGRPELLEKSLSWYAAVASKARAIAKRQGFDGVRWQKMTDNAGEESPSSVGAFLIWQQPHFIYFAELCYRDRKDIATLNKYKELVFATADFMASFAYYNTTTKRYDLGKGMIPAQERFKPEETFNPPFELVYWHWALSVAQQWRRRLHLPENKKWTDVMNTLAPLPVQNEKYLFSESATDSYTNPEFRTDHPAVLGAFGMLPATGQVDKAIMKNTFQWIWTNWSWKDTWGWDFPLTAMTATRLGLPEYAVDALLMPQQKNTYLVNGHNYQDERLRIYLPGNGGLLSAVALMCAGYDGCTEKDPGIPKNGKWKVRWEGLKPMP